MSARLARVVMITLLGLMVPATASGDEFGYKGWGPRVGISSDPDQVFGGVHFDLGEFAPHVRFQPSVEIGLGDDVLTLAGNFMVAYYFPVKAKVTPYAGGSLTAVYFDFDNDCGGFGTSFGGRNRCGDTDTEIGPAGVGGIETKLSGGARFLAELQLGFAELPEAKLTAGWTF